MSSELKEMNTAEENVETAKIEETVTASDTRDFELRMTDEELAKKKKFAEIWDKFTTGLLIFLMTSPILILGYIFLWFLTK